MKYRSDIDGLRAVAVLPVIFFHMGSEVISGGYVGVDVFFVISGFLITTILHADISRGTFSLWKFYDRRFRRILPAIVVVMLATMGIGWFVLTPGFYETLGQSVVATTLFLSNMFFWWKLDYFGPGGDTMPLLHTWSLAVEEQFYLFFPILLWLVMKFGRVVAVYSLFALFALSFVLGAYGVSQSWTAAYYWSPFRFWELLAGCILAVLQPRAPENKFLRDGLAVLGLLAILVPCVLLTEESAFPGVNALPPVLGATIIIWIGMSDQRNVAARILSWRPFVWVGLISYSLYLWHWPIIVFAKQMMLDRTGLAIDLAQLVLMFALAWGSWRYIEAPFRKPGSFSRVRIFAFSLTASVVIAALGLLIHDGNGYQRRFPEIAVMEQTMQAEKDEKRAFSQCIVGSDSRPWPGPERCFITSGSGENTLLWGDSHAHQYALQLHRLDDQIDENILVYAMTRCAPVFGHDAQKRAACRGFKDQVLKIVEENDVDRVVLSGLWDNKPELVFSDGPVSVRATVERLREAGVEVVILGDNPIYDYGTPPNFLPNVLSRQDPDAPFLLRSINNPDVNRELAEIVGEDNFFDPMAVLCQEGRCVYYDRKMPLMDDANHLTLEGAKRVILGLPGIFRASGSS